METPLVGFQRKFSGIYFGMIMIYDRVKAYNDEHPTDPIHFLGLGEKPITLVKYIYNRHTGKIEKATHKKIDDVVKYICHQKRNINVRCVIEERTY